MLVTSKVAVPVQMNLYLEQVNDGKVYKGFLEWEHGKLNFLIVFRIPISKLDIEEMPTVIRLVAEKFPITLTSLSRKNIPIPDDQVYAFFFRAILEAAYSYYHDPRTRQANYSSFPIKVAYGVREPESSDTSPTMCAQTDVLWSVDQEFYDKLVSLFKFDGAKLGGNGGLAGFCDRCSDQQLKDICPVCHTCIATHCKHT